MADTYIYISRLHSFLEKQPKVGNYLAKRNETKQLLETKHGTNAKRSLGGSKTIAQIRVFRLYTSQKIIRRLDYAMTSAASTTASEEKEALLQP